MLKVNCLVCNKDILTYPSWIKSGKSKYCSRECSMPQTNKILEKNGKKTRFSKGLIPWNLKGSCLTQARRNGKQYRLIFSPFHPFSSKKGYVREHRLKIEKQIGRYLYLGEVVHHKDGNTLNNTIENLELLTAKDHRIIHLKDNVHKRWVNYTPRGHYLKTYSKTA